MDGWDGVAIEPVGPRRTSRDCAAATRTKAGGALGEVASGLLILESTISLRRETKK